MIASAVGGSVLWWLTAPKLPALQFARESRSALERKGTLAEALERDRALVRIPPDRRFVAAFRDVSAIASSRAGTEVEVEWRGSRWLIRSGETSLGALSPLASFAEQLQALTVHAARSLSPESLPAVSLRGRRRGASRVVRTVLHGTAELEQANAAWRAGRRDAHLALAAARALGWHLLQSADQLELSDPVAARALAALALAHALDPSSGAYEECLLSYATGYSGHARALASRLADGDPLRALALSDDAGLERIAAHRQDFEARFLHLLRLAQRSADDWGPANDAWSKVEGSDYRAVALATSLWGESPLQGFGAPPAVLLLTSAWTEEPLPERARASWAAARSAKVEAAIEQAASELEPGPFFDADIFRGAHEALYFSALKAALMDPIRMGRSTRSARRLLEKLPTTEKSRLRELRDWYEIRVGWQEGNDVSAGRALATERGRFLGTAARAELLGALDWAPPPGEDDRAARVRGAEFVATLDARPAHRPLAASLVRGRMRDPMRADALESSLVRDDAPRRARIHARLLLRHGGVAALARELALPDATTDFRHAAYFALGDDSGLDPREAAALLGRLWQETGHDPWIYRPYRHLLAWTLEDWKTVETLARTRLAQLPADAPVEDEVRADLAQALRMQGRAGEALDAVQCCVRHYGSSASFQAVLALNALGRPDEALALADASRAEGSRKPWLDIAAAEAEWRRGNFEAAARRITPPRRDLDDSDFSDSVCFRMFAAFANEPVEKVLAAFDWLVRLDAQRGQRSRVEVIAAYFGARGRSDVAFAMYERLARFNYALWRDRNAEPLYESMAAVLAADRGRARCIALAWRALADWKGREAADAWILGLRAKPFRWELAPNFFAGGAPELLWVAYPESPPPSYVSLMRAHALALSPELAPSHGATLRAELVGGPARGDAFFARIALGMESEPSLLDAPLDARTLCQSAFYLGLAAQSRGDLVHAAEWYQVVLDTQLITFNVYGYAKDQLEAWRKADQPFEVAPRWDDPVIPRLAARR